MRIAECARIGGFLAAVLTLSGCATIQPASVGMLSTASLLDPEPLRLTVRRAGTNHLRIDWRGETNKSYIVQHSTNLFRTWWVGAIQTENDLTCWTECDTWAPNQLTRVRVITPP